MGKAQAQPYYSFLLLVVLILDAGVKSSESIVHKDSYDERVLVLEKKLFAFGDSYADTGNIGKSSGIGSWKFPYGITFPGKPTGRFSDGRVLTDFVAKILGVRSPILPYRVRKFVDNLSHYGVNFAYGGTGVFNTTSVLPSLSTQVSFMEQLIQQGIYNKEQLSSSVALISVAGNDYSGVPTQNAEALKNFTKSVVKRTSESIVKVLSLGIPRVAITTLVPFGCLPSTTAAGTTNFNSSTCTDQAAINQISIYHRTLLKSAAMAINNKYRNASSMFKVNVVVLDLYQGFSNLLHTPTKISGFANPWKPCCTGTSEGAYCASVDEKGNRLYSVCDSPKLSFFWDIVHPTQAGWAEVASYLSPSFHKLMSA